MRTKGINYDTGFFPAGVPTRQLFDPDVVRREMRVIADELHCTAVRISGGDPVRLSIAAEHAAAAGLSVWFSPFPCELTAAQMTPLFLDCADRAERLRRDGADVVLVTGCELSLFAAGFLPGDDLFARLALFRSTDPQVWAELATVPATVNAFLADTAGQVRERFGGQVTYAAGPWEQQLDWTPFDLVSVDAYRADYNAANFEAELRHHVAAGKPVVASEFGCCTYRGAAGQGGAGWMIIDQAADPSRLDGDYQRDETEQANYLRELLEIFERVGLDGAFWFNFAGYELPHRAEPRFDLDMASYGVVAMRPDEPTGWTRKESFAALAAAYA